MRGWRRAAGHTAALLAAVAIAGFAFVYRFNALGGRLGGLEDDHFPVLARAEMLLHGEQPLRDFADAELRGAWPALSYEVPAWAQRTWGRNLLSEARLTVGVLATCAGLVFLIARSLSATWIVALVAALAVVVSGAELYNFPKVLALTVAVPLLMWMLTRPSVVSIAIVAGWTAVAGLFRHDYAIYLALGAVAGLIARDVHAPRVAARRTATFLALLVVWLLPSAIWVQRYQGIQEYIASTAAVSRIERATRSLRDWPAVSLSFPLDEQSLVALIYYMFWAVPLCALLVLILGRLNPVALRHEHRPAPSRAEGRGVASRYEPVGVTLVTLALVVNYFFLRSNLESRFGDAIVPIVLVCAWMAGASRNGISPVARTAGWLGPSLVMAAILAALFQVNAVARELHTAGLSQSPRETARRYAELTGALRNLPPVDWTDVYAPGTLAAARYVAECSTPDDYVLVGAYASEIPVYARRRFAAGQGTFALGLYSSPGDQRRAIEHLRQQSAPIVLAGPEFATDYPVLWQYIASRYHEAGAFAVEGRPDLRVLVVADRAPQRAHLASGLPCFR